MFSTYFKPLLRRLVSLGVGLLCLTGCLPAGTPASSPVNPPATAAAQTIAAIKAARLNITATAAQIARTPVPTSTRWVSPYTPTPTQTNVPRLTDRPTFTPTITPTKTRPPTQTSSYTTGGGGSTIKTNSGGG